MIKIESYLRVYFSGKPNKSINIIDIIPTEQVQIEWNNIFRKLKVFSKPSRKILEFDENLKINISLLEIKLLNLISHFLSIDNGAFLTPNLHPLHARFNRRVDSRTQQADEIQEKSSRKREVRGKKSRKHDVIQAYHFHLI